MASPTKPQTGPAVMQSPSTPATPPPATSAQPPKPATTAVPSAKALTSADALKKDLEKMGGEFKAILPSHIPVEKFTRAAQTAIQVNPDLAMADRRILFGELMKCAQDGLVPDGREAVITLFRQAPKYNPMVGGICKRARNSGEISTIDAVVVCENDTYECWVDEKGQHFKHIRARLNRGNPILTYAYAITKDGGFFFEEISEEQMKHIESASAAKFGPWKGAFRDEMRRKSAIRRLSKYRLPSSSDLDMIMNRDNDMFDLKGEESEKSGEQKNTSSRLDKIVDAQVQDPNLAPVSSDPIPAEETTSTDELPI